MWASFDCEITRFPNFLLRSFFPFIRNFQSRPVRNLTKWQICKNWKWSLISIFLSFVPVRNLSTSFMLWLLGFRLYWFPRQSVSPILHIHLMNDARETKGVCEYWWSEFRFHNFTFTILLVNVHYAIITWTHNLYCTHSTPFWMFQIFVLIEKIKRKQNLDFPARYSIFILFLFPPFYVLGCVETSTVWPFKT